MPVVHACVCCDLRGNTSSPLKKRAIVARQTYSGRNQNGLAVEAWDEMSPIYRYTSGPYCRLQKCLESFGARKRAKLQNSQKFPPKPQENPNPTKRLIVFLKCMRMYCNYEIPLSISSTSSIILESLRVALGCLSNLECLGINCSVKHFVIVCAQSWCGG